MATETIKRDLKYFMRTTEPEIVNAPAPETFVDENGERLQMEIRVLTQEEINKINDAYLHRSMALDKKGNPLVSNGEVIWKNERDNAKAARHLIVEALVYPNLKDPKLMEHYHVVDVTDMPLKVFPRPDEYAHVVRVVMRALGLTSDVDDSIGSEVNDAKNS